MMHPQAQSQSLMLLLLVLISPHQLAAEHHEQRELPQPPPPSPQPPLEAKVAFHCDSATPYPAMTWAGPQLGWRPDASQTVCPATPEQILAYCRVAYPSLSVLNVAPAPDPVTIANWCPIAAESEAGNCGGSISAVPQLCVTSGYESASLLVPAGCKFGHKSAPDSRRNPEEQCRGVAQWNDVAGELCGQLRPGWTAASASYLLPCSRVGLFGGVEYVCCPPGGNSGKGIKDPARAAGGGEDQDKRVVQEYLTQPPPQGKSESQRFAEALDSLRRYESAREAALDRRLATDEERVFSSTAPGGSGSAEDSTSRTRLLAELTDQYTKRFLSLQREESAEADQLDSVHQERVTGDLRRRLRFERRLMVDSLTTSRLEAARYLARYAGLIGREATRVANRASRLAAAGSLTVGHLAALRQHLEGLAANLNDTAGLYASAREDRSDDVDKILGPDLTALKAARGSLARMTTTAASQTKLSTGRASSDTSLGQLAERFAEVLRRHSRLNRERQMQQQQQQQQQQQHHDLVERIGLLSHHSDRELLEHGGSSASATASSKTAVRAVLGVMVGMLALGVAVAVATLAANRCGGACGGGGGGSRCRRRLMRLGRSGPAASGYKLTLVDDQTPFGTSTQEPQQQQQQQPQQQQLSQPHHQGNGAAVQQHLTSMQVNGYENPTYKFYEN